MSTRSGPQTVETEIERKFVLLHLPWHLPRRARQLESAYLSVGDPEVRVARYAGEEGSYQITIKHGKGISRTEVILDVTDEVGDSIWATISPERRIRKLRGWYIGGWEVDVYDGVHEGLRIAEIELPSEDTPLPPLPEGMVLGPEVTDDARFKNKALSGMPRYTLELAMDSIRVALK